MKRCPLCRKEVNWDDNPWKPFCSERCQTIDLGRWASEDYRIPLTEHAETAAADRSDDTHSDEQA